MSVYWQLQKTEKFLLRMKIYFLTTLCAGLLIIPTYSSSSTFSPTLDCSSEKACLSHQTCIHGYCFCDEGYIRIDISCFKVKSYGESCYYHEQCPDHRMNCMKKENSEIDAKYCLCNKFHPWNETLKECVPAFHIKKMLIELQEKTDLLSDIQREADKVFSGVQVAGLSVVVLGGFFASICIIYGCCLRRCNNYGQMDTSRTSAANKSKEWDMTCHMAVQDAMDTDMGGDMGMAF